MSPSLSSSKLISAFKATAESLASKGDVDFTELNAAFTEYSDQLQASIDALVDISDEAPDVTAYTGMLATIKTSIEVLETDSKAGRIKRLTYKTPMTRKSKEDRFSQKVTSLEGVSSEHGQYYVVRQNGEWFSGWLGRPVRVG